MTSIARSTRAELLRLSRWPTVWVVLASWLALAVTFGYVFPYVSYRTGDTGFSTAGADPSRLLLDVLPAAVPHAIAQGTPLFGGALTMVLGALVAGNGYGWGTWKTVHLQGNGRISVTLGSLAALTAVVVFAVLTTLGAALALSTAVAAVEGQDLALPPGSDLAQGVGTALLVLGMWALAGYTLGTLARGPALAVGLGLVWVLVVENLLRAVGGMLGAVEALTEILPGTAAGSAVGALVGTTQSQDSTPGVLDVLSGERAVWTLLAQIVLLTALVLLTTGRRDLT